MNFATLKSLTIPEGVVQKIVAAGRTLWSVTKKPTYYRATALYSPAMNLAAASCGDHAIFAGGVYTNCISDTRAYDKFLTVSIPQNLKTGRFYIAAASSKHYAVFCSGYGEERPHAWIDKYDSSLTHQYDTFGLGLYKMAATTIADAVTIIGGGLSINAPSPQTRAFDSAFSEASVSNLSVARGGLAAATVGIHALFAGGQTSQGDTDVVDIYDGSLTRIQQEHLYAPRRDLVAVTIGDYALFAGGKYLGESVRSVSSFNTSLTQGFVDTLCEQRWELAGTVLGNYAMFGGGRAWDNIITDTTDLYDKSLTHSMGPLFSTGRQGLAAATVGNYALFGGGLSMDSSYLSSVDVYTIE